MIILKKKIEQELTISVYYQLKYILGGLRKCFENPDLRIVDL